MKNNLDLKQLDILTFAKNASALSGEYDLASFTRLRQEDARESTNEAVTWSLRGQEIKSEGGEAQIWLHLKANTHITMTCQRCLTPATFDLDVDRDFRFVSSEQIALEEDDENEEDLLVIDRKFNSFELIEDELIMSLPIVPRHQSCHNAYLESLAKENAQSPEFERPNPFAVLEQLKKPTNH
jgi:uncharacterized protein